MTELQEQERSVQMATRRWMAKAAVAALGMSVMLMLFLGIGGPRPGGTYFPPAPPWPPWFFHANTSTMQWSITLWLAEALGGCGLALALLAVRRGWRPKPRRIIAGSVVAVIALMALPPVDNGDQLLYAAYGRLVVLGHSPYAATPLQALPSGDPVRAAAQGYLSAWNEPSAYGPVATATEAAASGLAGNSPARTLLWLKIWNALAFLAVVLALDRAVRSDTARRVRAHLLWSVNPLMLWALMANGHNDVLAAAAGMSALVAMRRVGSHKALLAGVLLGLAIGVKAPYALYGVALAWTARRSPRSLAALTVGAAAVLLPGYLRFGLAAISATTSLASSQQANTWWHGAVTLLGWQHAASGTNFLGIVGCAVLAAILLWRMPSGPPDFPAIRIALALGLGLLIVSPLQAASYDAMIFPLLAVFPASRLDWVVVARNMALTAGTTPFLSSLNPLWLTVIERVSILGSPTFAQAVIAAYLLWLCYTSEWALARSPGSLPAGLTGITHPLSAGDDIAKHPNKRHRPRK